MARTPKTELTPQEKKAKADAAEQEALLREVDEAVRQGDVESFMSSYGKPLFAVILLGLAAFGGYLYWDAEREKAMEGSSEQLVTAFDALEAGNTGAAGTRLEGVEGGSPEVSAKMLRAGIAAEAGDKDTAAALLSEVADDTSAPEMMRQMALIRRTALMYDEMDAAEIVAAMQPLAVPGEPFFTSAGELLAHAYMRQDKRSEAGNLFAEIARHEDTPDSARSRMLNMAGILGVDAVDDVRDVVEAQQRRANGDDSIVSE